MTYYQLAYLHLATIVPAFFMPANVGPRLAGHFGFIHLFGLYVGGILIAAAFTFTPGRLLHRLLFEGVLS